MSDRFRDLERPLAGRPKDIVLMATVTGFESVRHPSRSNLLQFAQLFEPLYLASSDEARRQAVAALSRCPHVPHETALFIGCQPIAVAAIFLIRSQAIPDNILIGIAKSCGPAHANAIARRDNLSPLVVDALVSLHQGQGGQKAAPATAEAAVEAPEPDALPQPQPEDEDRLRRIRQEERLRQEIRALARVAQPANSVHDCIIEGLSETQEALLVRFARAREAGYFAATLADALGSSRPLASRILLDTSGHQLALTLSALGLESSVSATILTALYPHLAEPAGEVRQAVANLDAIDVAEAIARVRAWQRADAYTNAPETAAGAQHEPVLAPDRDKDARLAAQARPNTFSRQQQDRKQRSGSRSR